MIHYLPLMLSYGKDIITIINMMHLMYKGIVDYSMKGMFNITTSYSGGAKFKRPNGDIASVVCVGITTLQTYHFDR